MASNNVYNDENDLFYFESEHLALRGNKEYSELLKTIAILESQRAEAVTDIEKIIELQKSALEDPVSFIEKIKNKEDLGIPIPQKVVDLPDINWSAYEVPIPEDAFKLINQEHTDENKINKESKKLKTDNQFDTFNKPWTSEEQKRLEELLIQFPPEPIEMRRYKKIADTLGNRTVKQVTSRVQKYFLKLYKAGLPIPGRIPKISDKKKSYIHKHQRLNSYLYKPSTFFPDLQVPVYMTENENDDEKSPCTVNTKGNEKNELQIKINLLKKIRTEKQNESFSSISHYGFKCDNCNEEPIMGSRWHCFDCIQDSVDYCTDCMISQIKNPNNNGQGHPLWHNLQPVHDVEAGIEIAPTYESADSDSSGDHTDDDNSCSSSSNNFHQYDQDYVADNSKTYNYLDPNFLPE